MIRVDVMDTCRVQAAVERVAEAVTQSFVGGGEERVAKQHARGKLTVRLQD